MKISLALPFWGRGLSQITLAHEGGEGVSKMLTFANEGGGGVGHLLTLAKKNHNFAGILLKFLIFPKIL